MAEPFFPRVEKVPFDPEAAPDALAFRWYDAERLVLGKPMRDQLRIAVCWWHTFGWPGSDMFGAGTFERPWFGDGDAMTLAARKAEVAFEFFVKLGTPFFTFHDRDVAPEGVTLRESNANLERMLERLEEGMARTGVALLWGTANLFSHPRYAAGAATNPDPEVFAHAAAQVKHALEATHRLGGANYVLWGGREGYDTLLNTDLRRETEQLGRFMTLVVDHKHKIGFPGALLVEPKPMEPAKHQYDFDAATVHAFLRRFGLEREIKLNVEVNHATLAGHSFAHELAYAAANDLLGSVDVNRGDPQNGWDTDQFPNSAEETTLALYVILRAGGFTWRPARGALDAAAALYVILRAGGFTTGGCNFDAKLRRQSVAPDDLFHAHVGGIDTLARGLLGAARLIEEGTLERELERRYAGWSSDLGRAILAGERSLDDLATLVVERGLEPRPRSGRQELLENVVNRVTADVR